MRRELDATRTSADAALQELDKLREQRRLSEVLLRGAEERSSLRQAAENFRQAAGTKFVPLDLEICATIVDEFLCGF